MVSIHVTYVGDPNIFKPVLILQVVRRLFGILISCYFLFLPVLFFRMAVSKVDLDKRKVRMNYGFFQDVSINEGLLQDQISGGIVTLLI